MTPICVLRSGGEFTPAHVQWLARQVPGLTCLSDVEVPGVATLPLYYDWPGWWAKMELFRPDMRGDLLYLDLDTVVLGDLSVLDVGATTVLRDFTRPHLMGSGLMYLVEMDRPLVWAKFVQDPGKHIAECVTQERWGDQGFLQGVLVAQRWQDALPGRVVSYKEHCISRVPSGARVVCFHGKPRPWEVKKAWIPPIDDTGDSIYNSGTLLTEHVKERHMDEETPAMPKYFKDATGYCYVATEHLAKVTGMTPWDGAVDANGFAVDTPPVEEAKPVHRAARRPAPADVTPDVPTE